MPHDAVEYFYRCLLRLRADQLEAVLRVGEATDDFYRKELKAGLPAIAADGGGEEAAAADGAPLPIAGPLDVSGTRVWKRCLVSVPDPDAVGDPPAHKVYFDFQLHSFGQRGFIMCPRQEDPGKACIMHCYTEGFESRAEFAAALHHWASIAADEGCATSSQHLCQRPTPEWGRPLPEGLHVRDV